MTLNLWQGETPEVNRKRPRPSASDVEKQLQPSSSAQAELALPPPLQTGATTATKATATTTTATARANNTDMEKRLLMSCICRKLLQFHHFFIVVFLITVIYTGHELNGRYHPRVVETKTDIINTQWIILSCDSDQKPMADPLNVPGKWILIVSDNSSQVTKRCPACLAPSLSKVTQTWALKVTAGEVPEPVLECKLRLMTQILYSISKGAGRLLFSPYPYDLDKAVKRLVLDTQLDGVRGIEYMGLDLSLDSFHFTYRDRVIDRNPCLYRLRKDMKPLWTVGVRCRATENKNQASPFLVDPHSPPVFSSVPKFSVLDFSTSHFGYDGFWAAFTTMVSPGSESEIWSLWAQRLLQELDSEMAMTSLPCPKGIIPKSTTGNVFRHSELAFKKVSLWKCPRLSSFYRCGITLAEYLRAHSLVEAKNLRLLLLWFDRLASVGYPEPKRKVQSRKRKRNVLRGCIIHTPKKVDIHPGLKTAPTKLFPSIETNCPPYRGHININPFDNHSIIKNNKVQDIALVVIFFDGNIYKNIRFLEDLYGNYFSVRIYCGPNAINFKKMYLKYKTPLNYIEVSGTQGFLAYECLSRAMMINFDVNGYLEMADDVVLNSWNLVSLPRHKFWFQRDLRIASRHQQRMYDFAIDFSVPWWPWSTNSHLWGAKGLERVWQTFNDIRKSDKAGTREIVNTFLNTLTTNSGKPEYFFYCSSDIFYVPNRVRESWSFLSEIFFKNNVFLDIAVPTLMNGLDTTADIFRMEGDYLWYNNRENYAKYYRDDQHFLHPWKLSWILHPVHAVFMCNKVLPLIARDLTMQSGNQSLASQQRVDVDRT